MDVNEKLEKKEAEKILKENKNVLVDENSKSFVSLQHIDKVYPNGVKAVYDFNLDINKNEFVALVGPSGCGKSTTLRMVAGLEEITDGSLFINKVFSNYIPSKDRNIAMVFQSYALYPNKNVYDNIAFGLKIRHVDKKEIEKRVFSAADILDLGEYLDRFPRELSGGQMQRVALGRAIVRQASLFLMDEPLSNLDAKLRVQMRSEIVRIHREVNATTIYVTHDQTEAMTMADKIVVMNKGFVQQIGKPIDVYKNPDNLFVATFIGSPSMNIIKGVYDGKDISFGELKIKVSPRLHAIHNSFYKKRIKDLQNILDNFDSFGKEEMDKMESCQIYVKSEKNTASKKKQHFVFLRKLFRNRKKELEEKNRKTEELHEKIRIMLEDAKKALDESHEVLLGIRPEDFKFANSNRKLKKVIIKPEIIELLGAEYVIYTTLCNTKIALKLDGSHKWRNESNIKVGFDETKIHLFDIDSGLAIKHKKEEK